MAESKDQESRRVDLANWMRVALLDLEGKSREQHRDKITERYHGLVAEALSWGRSDAEAHRAAMDSLGDPWLFQSGAPLRQKSLQIVKIYQALMQVDELDWGDKEVVWWLERAIPDLSPRALEVVCGEFVTHYQDALEAARAEGLQQADASRRALESLGDARAIHDQLARAYPDSAERKRLKGLKRIFDNPRAQLLGMLLGQLFALGVFLILAYIWRSFSFAQDCIRFSVIFMTMNGLDVVSAFMIFGRLRKAIFLRYTLGTCFVLFSGGCLMILVVMMTEKLDLTHGGQNSLYGIPHLMDALIAIAGLLPFVILNLVRDIALFRKIHNVKAEFENQGPDQYA